MTTDGAVTSGRVYLCMTGSTAMLTSDFSGFIAVCTAEGQGDAIGWVTHTD